MVTNILNIFGTGIERFIKLPVQFAGTTIVLRELGVAATGNLSFILATYLLAVTIASNGLNQIYIKKYASRQRRENSALINYFAVQNIYSILGSLLFLVVIGTESLIYLTLLIPIILSQLNLFKARMEAERVLIQITPYETIVTLGFAAIKIYFAAQFTLETLSILLATEYSCGYLLFIKFYRRGDIKIRNLNTTHIKRLATKSIWFILIAIAISLNMRIDQLMIYHILTAADNGNYSALVRIVEPLTAVFLIFIPTINALAQKKSKLSSIDLIRQSIRYGTIILLILIIALIQIGETIFTTLYGTEFSFDQIGAVFLYISMYFIFIGAIGNSQYVKEGMEKYLCLNIGIASIVNILLNLILLQKFGATGACFATLVSYMISGILGDFLWSKTSFIGHLKLQSLLYR